MAHTKSAGKMLRGGAVALAAAACLALNACGNQNENPPQTATPTTIESESPATWPDGSPILPGDQTDIYGERVTGREDETGPTDPESATGTENESATTTQENEPAAGSPAGSLPTAEILKGVPGAATRTGLQPLPVRKMEVPDPNNSRNLPTKKIEHAYGAAKNGVPHQISIDNQRFFNTKRYAAVAYDDQTKDEKVLYLTFDCGYENGNTAKILDVLKEKQVPAAFFCTVDELKRAPDVVARMINEGHIVGNHSVSHPSFAAIDRTAMAKEILEADNYLRENFGYSAPFFRFPKGEYNESALDAVASLGFTSVFWSASYADWDVNAQKGAQHALDTVLARLHPGAVLLLHSVSSDNAAAMAQIIDSAREQGYAFRNLTTLPLFRS